MADQFNAIIKIRRGLDSERRNVILESGEIAYSTDVKRMFVGDGSLSGGTVVGNTNYIGTSPNSYGIKNDLFFDTSTYQTYILSSDSGPDNISNYVKISPSVDDVTLKSVNNTLSIKSDYFDGASTGFLRLTGGTMGGYITLHSNPISAYHAATKGYVDQKVIKSITISNPLTSYELTSDDNGCILSLSSNMVSCFIHCPNNSNVGFNVKLILNSDSYIYILPKPSSSSAVNQIDGYNMIRKKYGVCDILLIDNNKYLITGDLSTNI
jgi:hypothetical protein